MVQRFVAGVSTLVVFAACSLETRGTARARLAVDPIADAAVASTGDAGGASGSSGSRAGAAGVDSGGAGTSSAGSGAGTNAAAGGAMGRAGTGGAGAGGAGAGGRAAGAGAAAGGGAAGCSGMDATDSDSDGTPNCADDAPYGYQKRLTFDGSQLVATLSSFPVLVRLRDQQLTAAAARADGPDIRFVASDGATALDFELEAFDAPSGEFVAWVKVPSLQAGIDTVVIVVYGDGRGGRSSGRVWEDYQHVWHLAQDPASGGGAIKDATGRADATARGNMNDASLVAGIAAQGLAFDGTDDELTFASSFTGSGPSTLSAWVQQFENNAAYGGAVIAFGNEQPNQARFLLSLDSQSGVSHVGFYSNDLPGPALATRSWRHLVWVWDGAATSIYVDGRLASGPTAHTGANTSGAAGKIGNSTFSYPRFLRGQLDEVRVATRALTSAWVSAEYQSQRPDSTFLRRLEPQQVRRAP